MLVLTVLSVARCCEADANEFEFFYSFSRARAMYARTDSTVSQHGIPGLVYQLLGDYIHPETANEAGKSDGTVSQYKYINSL